MTICLRTKENKTVVDIELDGGNLDIRAATIIPEYSKILVDAYSTNSEWEDVITDFTEIDEIRGWFWEVYLEQVDNPGFEQVKAAVIEKLQPIAQKYGLAIVTD